MLQITYTFQDSELGAVQFRDLADFNSAKCHPRDILIISDLEPEQFDRVKWDICADIRRSQGIAEIGLMKNAKV